MQLDIASETHPSHPPTPYPDERTPNGCDRRRCRQRRWRVCGRPGCGGLQAYPRHPEAERGSR